jgi:hypothetical protein
MSSLLELQRQFAAAVLDGAAAPAQIMPGGADAAARLAIYRDNWRGNLRNALRATCPVVERLVGAEFFAYMADSFIAQTPSRSSNLEDYGREFADFIAAFAPAQSLPYLPDVARLEMLIDEVLAAPDEDFELPTEAGPLRWRGAAALLRSPYPVHRIWQVNQPAWAGDATVDLDQGAAAALLIRRDGADIRLEPLARDPGNDERN